MFDDVDVKDSNAIIFIKDYIDDMTTISNNFTKFFFEFKNFFKEESAARAQKKEQKKKKSLKKKRGRELREDEKEKNI